MKTLKVFSISLVLAVTCGLSSYVQASTSLSNACDFSKSIALRPTKRYGIFGDDEFDTAVCGYLVTRNEQVWGEFMNVAYFRILKFRETGFQQAIAAGIQQGNSVNALRQGKYELNLGCFENGRIKGQQHEPGKPYMTDAVEAKLLNSSASNPIKLILSFGKHQGSGCACCNLAHYVRTD
jgi:hypothetical protein